MSTEIDDLIDALRRMKREQAQMRKRSQSRNEAGANACAIELRRIKHEAHCLAVEIGIADRRDQGAYSETTAPAGMGREFLIERREPATIRNLLTVEEPTNAS